MLCEDLMVFCKVLRKFDDYRILLKLYALVIANGSPYGLPFCYDMTTQPLEVSQSGDPGEIFAKVSHF